MRLFGSGVSQSVEAERSEAKTEARELARLIPQSRSLLYKISLGNQSTEALSKLVG